MESPSVPQADCLLDLVGQPGLLPEANSAARSSGGSAPSGPRTVTTGPRAHAGAALVGFDPAEIRAGGALQGP